jgi:hypothetical protein
MTDTVVPQERPPYGAALAVTLVVLAGYVASLAPTVTFWDAGEFIAATKILGIPHPPGTPLFVLMGHVWAALLPLGSWAYRTNLMSATFSAAGAGVWFLVVYESLKGGEGGEGGRNWIRLLGAAAAAIIGAFSFTNWQNSNETEVYAVSTFMIATSCWMALRWRAARGTRRAPVYLLLIVYLQGLSVANHLLALLVGPAIIGFIVFTLRSAPLPDALERRHEWAKLAAMAGIWALLIGTGLGNVALLAVGAICFAVAALFALTAGAGGFAAVALLLAVVGVSPYLFLYIRSGQHPMVNEAAPATWDALLAVIRRAQYPPRGPFDDPTVAHGLGNPGRSLTIIWLQLQNYLLYWLWQFGKSGQVVVQAVVFAAFLGLGVRGSLAQRRNDRGAWWLLFLLWLVTGVGLVAYMNFKPGFSLGYPEFPDGNLHEVRERDYFFVVSFVVWGLWAGMGLWSLVKRAAGKPALSEAKGQATGRFALALFLVALIPPALNWREASRSTGADRTLAADLAYNLLNTVPPYGILFTYGDNDTFPLWWAQEVAGIRKDVTVVCLALAQTDWYMRQLRDNPVRDFDEAAAPKIWQGLNPVKPTWPLHSMTDEEVRNASTSPILIDSTMTLPIGPIVATLKAQTVLYPNDIVSLRIIQQNLGRRAIIWSLTTGDSYEGLRDYVIQQAMGFRLATALPDSSQPGISLGGIGNVAVDMPLTQRLAWETYQYGYLLSGATDRLESTAASMASSLSIPFTILAYHADAVGDTAAVVKNLERAEQIAPNEAIRSALTSYKSHLLPAAP